MQGDQLSGPTTYTYTLQRRLLNLEYQSDLFLYLLLNIKLMIFKKSTLKQRLFY